MGTGLIVKETIKMWAKGPMSGYSPKSETLRFLPKSVCEKKRAMCDITGYIIYPTKEDAKSDTNAISSAGSAKEAWGKALAKIARYNVVTKGYDLI